MKHGLVTLSDFFKRVGLVEVEMQRERTGNWRNRDAYKCWNNFWGKLWALIPVFSPCVKYGLK